MNPSDFEFSFVTDTDLGNYVHFQGKSGQAMPDAQVEDWDDKLADIGLENLNGNDYSYDLADWNYESQDELKDEIEAIGFVYKV